MSPTVCIVMNNIADEFELKYHFFVPFDLIRQYLHRRLPPNECECVRLFVDAYM